MVSFTRQIFAFSRDKGCPFGHWIARLNATGTYPVNACFKLVVWAFVVLINLSPLGRVVAFQVITSLQIVALMSTYLVSLICIIWRRLRGGPLPPSLWTLERAALPINIVAVGSCVYLVISLPWLGIVPVKAATMK